MMPKTIANPPLELMRVPPMAPMPADIAGVSCTVVTQATLLQAVKCGQKPTCSCCGSGSATDAGGSRLQRFVSQGSSRTHAMLLLYSPSIFLPLQPTRCLEGWMGVAVKTLARFEAKVSPRNLVQQQL